MMREVIPVHDLEIRIAAPFAGSHVVMQPGDRPVVFRKERDALWVHVPKLTIWEVLEVVS